jgi:hypothetical protein
MTFRNASLSLMIAVFTAGVLVTGCAAGPTASTPEPTTLITESGITEPPAASKAASTPQIPPMAGDEITVTGIVEKSDVEGGCTVLRAEPSRVFELKGDYAGISTSQKVVVTGRLRSDMVTICQMGLILEVITIRLAA